MWFYEGKPFEKATEEFYGFVYLITEKDTDKKYIGKKLFWNKKTKTLKGKKVRYLAESDWKKYFGSSKQVKEAVDLKGENNYHREILKLCMSKGECSYWEAKMQFEYDVLLREDFYNELIMCRINSTHVKGLLINDQARTQT